MTAVEKEYAEDPVGFAVERLGGQPWAMQARVLEALREHPRVTVRSGHGVGKTWTAACAVLWFLYTRRPTVVLTTAPTQRQVREVLWREIRRLHRRLAEGGCGEARQADVRETAIRLADDRFALGLTTDEPDRFQGFHSPHMLVVVDEASGVAEAIYEAILSVLTGEEARLLLIGNPLHCRGFFYESHRREGWAKFVISALDSPNARDGGPGASDRLRGLVTAAWIEERRREWGEDSPLYRSRVLGEFPDQASDALVPLSWIEAAVARGRTRPAERSAAPAEMGVDVARYGTCETVACVRRGDRVLELAAWRGADLMRTVERVRRLAERHGAAVIRVDGVGAGAGVVDRLREIGLPGVVDVNVGRAPGDPDRFGRLRDEIFFALRERFREGRIALPDDPVLVDQLAALTYRITPRGQQCVEGKAEMAARGHASPDRADALALAFAPLPAGWRPVATTGRKR